MIHSVFRVSVVKVKGGQVSSTKEALKRKKSLPKCDLLPKNTPLLNTFTPSFLPPPPYQKTKAAELLTGRSLGPPYRPKAQKKDKPSDQRQRHTRISSWERAALYFSNRKKKRRKRKKKYVTPHLPLCKATSSVFLPGCCNSPALRFSCRCSSPDPPREWGCWRNSVGRSWRTNYAGPVGEMRQGADRKSSLTHGEQ